MVWVSLILSIAAIFLALRPRRQQELAPVVVKERRGRNRSMVLDELAGWRKEQEEMLEWEQEQRSKL
jgi:hypothetical protein